MDNNTYLTKSDDFPALFCAADSASTSAQFWYLWLFRLDIFFVVIGSILSSISLETTSEKKTLFFFGGISYLISLFITIAIKFFSYEKIWYGGRAVAESVKTLAWRYMTCAEPYQNTLGSKEVDDIFHTELNKIRDERKQILGDFKEKNVSQPQITNKMREIRNLSIGERKNFYIHGRIADQRKWYSLKAASNKFKENLWFIGVMFMQLLAGIAAFCLINYPDFPINLTSIFSTVAMGFLAWLQVKRHQEQSQSYNLAAQELASILDKAVYIVTDEELSVFVADAETAVSREHTLWVARRDQV